MVFSDLLDASGDEKVMEALGHLRFRGHDVVVFHVLDSDEVELPFQQVLRFQDMESGANDLMVDPVALRGAYQRRLREFRDYYRRECLKQRIDFVPVDNSMGFDHALLAYLQKRAGR